MRIVVTGTPGVGKTTLAKALAERLKHSYINERDFAVGKGIGSWDPEDDELEIPLDKLEKGLNEELKGEKDVVLEGHLLCEIGLNVDAVVLLRLHPELLEARLELKGWSEEKVQDNVHCEGIDYCKKHVLKSYKGIKVIEVQTSGSGEQTLAAVLDALGVTG